MGLAGFRFLDSPRSGSLRFLEPKPSGLQALLRKLLTQNTNPSKKKTSGKKLVIIAGTLNKLGSQNKFSKLMIIDPPYTKVSPTLGFRAFRGLGFKV